jgi:hypothetical protein
MSFYIPNYYILNLIMSVHISLAFFLKIGS